MTITESPPATVICSVAGRPRSLNAERSGSTWEHRRITAAEREQWGWAWTEARQGSSWPRTTHPDCFVVAAQPYLVGPLQDAGNCYPSVKAAIDGAIDARLVHDDDPTRLLRVTLHRPIRVASRNSQRLVVVLTVAEDE